MSKKVRKSTSIVSGVLISASLINNAVSLASAGSMVKAGITALGKVAISTVEGGTDLLVVPVIKSLVSWALSYLFLFLLLYGFYYNRCVLHTGKVASGINTIISIPSLINTGIKAAINYVFAESKKPDDKNEVLEAKEQEKDIEVISVEDLKREIESIEESLSKYVSESEKEISNKIEVLEKRLEATRGSLNYKLNWLKFQLGAPFRSETRKRYAVLASYLKDVRKGLDSIKDIVKEWKKIKESKENKLSLLLLEKSEGEKNALIDLLGEIERLGEGENTFLKQYSQNFFAEYIVELEREVLKEFNIIVKKEEKEGEKAFFSLISRVSNFDKKTKGRFSEEADNLSNFLKNSQKLLFVEKQVQGILKKCGLGCSRDLEKLLNFVFGKGLWGMLGDVFVGLFAADDNINKPKKELKDEDLLTILEKIGSKKSDLVTLKEAITSAVNELKKFEENDFSKSILEKAEKTEKMLGSLFEEKGGDGRNLMSVAREYAECYKEVKKIKEKTFDEEKANTLIKVLQLLSAFYEKKSKQLDDLLKKISTFEGKCNKDFVECLKKTVVELKNKYDQIKSALSNFAFKFNAFLSDFETYKKEKLHDLATSILAGKGSINSILFPLETEFTGVLAFRFVEVNTLNEMWENWKSSFIKESQEEVDKVVKNLKEEDKKKEEQEKKDLDLIQKTKEAINSFNLEKDYKSKLGLLEEQLGKVSKQSGEEAGILNFELKFLFDFCEYTLNEKVSLSEKLKRLTDSIQSFQDFPAFFESVVNYLREQFNESVEKGQDEDFYQLLLSLKDFEKVPEGNSEGDRVSSLLNKFYTEVKDVVVKKAEESINNIEELEKNFGKNAAKHCKSLAKLEKSAADTNNWTLEDLALYFRSFYYIKKGIESDILLSKMPSLEKKIKSLGKKFKEKFKKIKLADFLCEFINCKVDKNEEKNFINAFDICLTSLELSFSEGVEVKNFFAAKGRKNYILLEGIRTALQQIPGNLKSGVGGSETKYLDTVLGNLSELKGDEKVIQYIKSAVVSCMSNIFCDYFICRISETNILEVFNNFSGKTFTKLFKLFDEVGIIDDNKSKDIKRLWFLSLFGNFYNRGIGDSKWFNMVKDSKFISDDDEKELVLDFFNTLNGGFEEIPALPDDKIKSNLETFFGSDKDFANIAYSIFASYKKGFRFNDLAGKGLNMVGDITSDIAEKGFNMLSEVTKNSFNLLKGGFSFGNLLKK